MTKAKMKVRRQPARFDVELPSTENPSRLVDAGTIEYDRHAKQWAFRPGESITLFEDDLPLIAEALRSRKRKRAK